jgi:spore germination cell wall hydrolase CwlJ-like protein
MITALLQEVRIWPVAWKRRWRIYWLHGEKGNLAFGAALAVPILAVGAIVYFAYAERLRVPVAQVEATEREAKVAHQRSTDLQCLAENVYFEARGEPLDGQYAVAEVTLNRSHSRYFPKTVCGVVHEAHWDPIRKRYVAHFSWTELGPMYPQDTAAWKQAMAVATATYDDTHQPIVPGALFYHSTEVLPVWAKTKRAVATIGNHIFYR